MIYSYQEGEWFSCRSRSARLSGGGFSLIELLTNCPANWKLSALVGASGILPPALVEEALTAKFKDKINLEAFRKGIETGENHM